MKFNDGYWMTKKHYALKYAGSAYDAENTGGALQITATPGKIYNRGMTLGGATFTVTLSSPLPDVIGVKVVYHAGIPAKTPDFALNSEDGFAPDIDIAEKTASLTSGASRVEVDLKEGWAVRFYTGGDLKTSSGSRSLAAAVEDEVLSTSREAVDRTNHPWIAPEHAPLRLRERLSIDVGEKIYGFGERFGAFVKNGQTIDCWNSDGGTNSELAYKNIPFYLSNRGYGVFVANPGAVSFEVACEVVSAVSFTVPENTLEYYFIGGGTPAAVLSNYTALTGRPSLPPPYTFGLWLTTSFTTNYDEKTVMSFVDGMAQRDIPLSVFHFDCFWMREFRWCDFEWDSRVFPDPAGMLARMKAKGLHICVWVNPYIGEKSPLFKVGLDNGYFIKNRGGSVYQSDEWQPGMAVVDFTNPSAREWYASKIRALIDSGVDCIKTDFGERIPRDCVYFDGSDPVRMHNYYSYLYNETVAGELRDGCLFARSATAGCQKFPCHWGGDCSATYQSMAETLRGGLSLTASGFGFFSHDISGFEDTAPPDIYKRWTAFGMLSTHSRLHGSSSYRVPWLFDEEAVDVLRHFTKLKGALMPYLWTQAVKTSRTGVPMMRATVIDYPSDPVAADCDRQYLLGDNLLVAPVFNDRGEVEFYVPTDRTWYDLQSGEGFTGSRYYRRTYDYFGLPLLVRPCSLVVTGNFEDSFDYNYGDNTTVVVGEMLDGECACCDVQKTDGTKLRYAARRFGEVIKVICDDSDAIFGVRSLQGLETE